MFKIISFFLFCGSIIAQQKISVADSIIIPEKFTRFHGVDIHENLFFSNNETLIKKTENQTFEYANFTLGIPTSISIINPLEILVYYKQTNAFVLLDRFLNEIKTEELNFTSTEINSSHISNSKDQWVWIVNQNNNQICTYNYFTSKTINCSVPNNTSTLLFKSNFNYAINYNGKEIQLINNYGRILEKIKLEKVNSIEISSNHIYVFKEDSLNIYDFNFTPLAYFKLEKNKHKNCFVTNEILYIYNGSSLLKHKLNIPTN